MEQQDREIVAPQPEDQEVQLAAHPAKIIRIASMIRELLQEARQSSLDESSRQRLRKIYERSLSELKEVLSEDLQRELDALTIQFDATPTESEIRVAQAQLVGWLEGLFHGIQAALWVQQMQTKAQFQEMRRRALPSGSPGQYL